MSRFSLNFTEANAFFDIKVNVPTKKDGMKQLLNFDKKELAIYSENASQISCQPKTCFLAD